MIGLTLTKSAVTLPWSYRKSNARSRVAAARRTAYSKLLPVLQSVVALAIGGTLLMVTTGMHIPSVFRHSSEVAAASDHTPPKPKLVGAAQADTCTARQSDTSGLFAPCASFAVDYTKQSKGTVNKKFFTVYEGEPVANHEAQYYTADSKNIRVDNGSLVFQALNDPRQGYKYTSARIDTNGKEDFLYGRLVVRAMLPSSIGTWPAIWLLPSAPKYASLSPASDTTRYLNDGEIDIAEAIGTQPHMVYGIAHSLAYPEDGVNREYFDTVTLPDNDTVFHDYALDWTPTSLTLSVDGHPYFTYTKKPGADWRSWPYDQPFYLVINLALGGSWGGQDTVDFPGDGVDASKLPATLKVQSVRYYAYTGPR